MLFTMKAKGLPELASWLASFGGIVEVKQPHMLFEMVKEIHARGHARYERGSRIEYEHEHEHEYEVY